MRYIGCALIVGGTLLALSLGCDVIGQSTIGLFPPDSEDSNGEDGSGTGSRTTFGGINATSPAGQGFPEIGLPVSIVVISRSSIQADVVIRFFVSEVEVHRTELRVQPKTTVAAVGPDLTTRVIVNGTYLGQGPTPSAIFLAATDFLEHDTLEYIIPDLSDLCPDDPDKDLPGFCGCGVPDVDADDNGVTDCMEEPAHPIPDTDGDGMLDDVDNCPMLANPGQEDCDGDSIGDACTIASCQPGEASCSDCNNNGIPDGCDLTGAFSKDCNANETPDECDLSTGASLDDNVNGIPDECEPVSELAACCMLDGSCLDLTYDQCAASEGLPQSPGMTCAQAFCTLPPVTEACCLDTGDCLDLSVSACNGAGGTSQGAGSSCLNTKCLPATEACCNAYDGTCSDMTAEACVSSGGTPMGPNTDCATASCPEPAGTCCLPEYQCGSGMTSKECSAGGGEWLGPYAMCEYCPQKPVSEACCMADGTCQDLTYDACMMLYGIPEGFGTTCVSTSCPQEAMEACCQYDGTCQDVPTGSCAGDGQGPYTTCATNACAVLTEACCFDTDGSCSELTEYDCFMYGGLPQGVGSSCGTASCYPELGACCMGGDLCEFVGLSECSVAGGEWLGPDSTCDACYLPPQPAEACCLSGGGCADVPPNDCYASGGLPLGVYSQCTDTGACMTFDTCQESITGCDCVQSGGAWLGAGSTCSAF